MLCRLRRKSTRSRSRGFLVVHQNKPVDDESKRDPSDSAMSPESSMRRRRRRMEAWIVVISFVRMSLSINVGPAWNYPKSCRRNPSNDWGSRLIYGRGGISSSASRRHIWRRLPPFSAKIIKVVKNSSNGICFITFSHGRPDIKEESMCRHMVWMPLFAVEFSRLCRVSIAIFPNYGIIGSGF